MSSTPVSSSRRVDVSKHGLWLAGGVIAVASVGAYIVYSRRATRLNRPQCTDAAPSDAASTAPASAAHNATKDESVLLPALATPVPPTPFEAALRHQGGAFAAVADHGSPACSDTSQGEREHARQISHDILRGGVSRDQSMDHLADLDAPGSANASCRSTRSNRSSDIDGAKSIPSLLKARNVGQTALEIGAMLGRGSFGKVYKGRWKGAMVAIKVIEHSADDNSKLDGLREALLCSNIQHPNVLITYRVIRKNAKGGQLHGQVGSLDSAKGAAGHTPCAAVWQPTRDTSDTPPPAQPLDERQQSMEDVHETWLISEYCDKGNLDRAVLSGRFHSKQTRAPNLVAIYRCLLDIAGGMDYLHSLGVLHGDLKGGNVLLKSTSTFDDPRGFLCKIGDFGLSRVLEADNAHVTTNTYGTVSYCAPEVLKDGRLTRAADVYSFAMMMWEMWMGEGLFRGLNSSQVFFKVMMGYRPPVPEGMPQGYSDLMTACWHEDPAQRPPFEDVERYLRNLYYAASAGDDAAPRDSRRSLELNPWG